MSTGSEKTVPTNAEVELAAAAEAETEQSQEEAGSSAIARRFRGFLPVVIDVETGGFNPATDALLEVAAVLVRLNDEGDLVAAEKTRYLVKPFPGASYSTSSPTRCRCRIRATSARTTQVSSFPLR